MYEEVDGGRCTTQSVTKEDCEVIAQEKESGFSEISDPFFPPGCYDKREFKRVYFNTHISSANCSEERSCICVGIGD